MRPPRALLLVAALAVAGASDAATKQVAVGPGGSFAFVDDESGTSTTTIAPGDTVAWVWRSGGHSVTRPGAPDPFDTGVQDAGFSFRHVFATPGRYPYHCTPHQIYGMTGAVVVTGMAGAATTTTTVASATTTTFGLTPGLGAAFAAVDGRLAALAADVDGTPALARRRRRAAVALVRRARTLEQRAAHLLELGRPKGGRAALRQALRRLRTLDRRLRAVPGGDALLRASAGIQADLQALLAM